MMKIQVHFCLHCQLFVYNVDLILFADYEVDQSCWSDGGERKRTRRRYESSTSSRFILGKRSNSACSFFKEYIERDENRFDFLAYKQALRREQLLDW